MEKCKTISKNIQENLKHFEEIFPSKTSADIIKKIFCVSGKDAAVYHINGMLDTENAIKILDRLQKAENCERYENAEMLAREVIPYTDCKTENNLEKLTDAILSAQSVVVIDGYEDAIILDTKKYPSRSIEEPEKNKTMRGPRDGFGENILTNTALVRRRIKSRNLMFESFEIGSETKTKVMLGYMKGKADEELLEIIRKRLSSTSLVSLTLTQETLTQELFGKTRMRRLNPFPKVRFIERPDTAASMLIEGKIMILCDTTPTAIFVPITIYDFIEETDDYYFPPLTGTYLRILRIAIILISVFLTPTWLLITKGSFMIHENFSFITKVPESTVPLWLQLILIELMVDALKIASLNTPNTIANSLGVVSGLLLGDFAIDSGWFIPQTILYSSICAIANYIPTNYEIGYCFKFCRIGMIIFVELWGKAGLLISVLLILIILASNKTADQCLPFYIYAPKLS